jgi:hypothetical protein
VGIVGDDEAAHDVAVAAEVLGEGVDGHVGAEFEGADEEGRGEGVVDDEAGAGGAAELGDFVDLADAEDGVGDGLHEDGAGLFVFDGAGDGVEVADIDERGLDAEGGEDVHQEIDGGAVEGVGGDDLFAAVEERGGESDFESGHAGGAGEGAVAGFESCAELLESVGGGVVVAGVGVAFHFVGEDLVGGLDVLVDVAGGGDDGGGDGDVGALLFAVTGVDGFGEEVHVICA